MRKRRSFTAATLALAAVLLLPLGGVASAASGDDMAPLAGPPARIDDPRAQSFAVDLIRGMDPATGGIAVDVATRTITVMVVRGRDTAALRQRVAAAHYTGYRIKTADVTYDAAYLDDLRQNAIWRQAPTEVLDHVVGTQVDTRLNRVVVILDNVTSELRRALRKQFGDKVAVRRGERLEPMSGRYTDPSPHSGGARLIIGIPGSINYGLCSAGFPATYNGNRVMVTAGHCLAYTSAGVPPYEISNGAWNGEGGCVSIVCWFGVQGDYGHLYQTRFKLYATQDEADHAPESIDIAMIAGSAVQPVVYRAESSVNTSQIVSNPGSSRSPSGSNLCVSGATTWGHCGYVVVLAGPITLRNHIVQQAPWPSGYVRVDVWVALNPDTSLLLCNGDSGGTVYGHFGTGEMVYGVAVDTNKDGTNCGTQLGFTYWGQASGTFPGYLPIIA